MKEAFRKYDSLHFVCYWLGVCLGLSRLSPGWLAPFFSGCLFGLALEGGRKPQYLVPFGVGALVVFALSVVTELDFQLWQLAGLSGLSLVFLCQPWLLFGRTVGIGRR